MHVAKLQSLGLTVGDAAAPASPPPYVVVYQIPGGGFSGQLGRINDDAEIVYQVTCVGVSRQQAEWLEDKANGLLTGITVSGRSIPLIRTDGLGGIRRDDSIQPPVFVATPRFRFYSTV